MADEVKDVLDDLTIDEMIEEAAGDHSDIDSIREKTKKIIDDTRAGGNKVTDEDDGPLAGLEHMHSLSLSIGLPVPRILFNEMVNVADASSSRKRKWLKNIKNMSKIKETGCIEIEIPRTPEGNKRIAYLVLDECDENHDMTAQLDKIYSKIPEEKQEEIRKHLSMLVYLGRSAYGQMLTQIESTMSEIKKKVSDTFDPRTLGIDAANTTIFIDHPNTKRVGIFVRFEDEIN